MELASMPVTPFKTRNIKHSSLSKIIGSKMKSSKIYQQGSIQLQIHFYEGFNSDFSEQKILEKIRARFAIPFPKCLPYAWRVKNQESDLVVEEYKDKGLPGAGNKLLRILRKRKFVDAIICVSLWYSVLPLNSLLDHFFLISCASVFLEKFMKIEFFRFSF